MKKIFKIQKKKLHVKTCKTRKNMVFKYKKKKISFTKFLGILKEINIKFELFSLIFIAR